MGRIIGYVRVSTKGQLDGYSIDQQIGEILSVYKEVVIYEEGLSGAKERPVFNEVLSILEKDDILVVTKLDRFCRTTKEGLQYIDMLLEKRVKIHILNMGLIENTPVGKLIVTNLLAFAEFERAMIIERTQSGKAIAKTKEGFKEGRPKKFTKKQLDNALSMLNINGGNYSYSQVEELLGISKSTLIRENNKRKIYT
ncbi:MAG: resolvase [Clostridium sp. 26_22]|jgi:DNA-invertase hin|uniref:recombinase family protein n=1 Tax=Clostridium sp. TaxID=1506 RepID=UPI00095AB60F|nr:recombinase family protein [Clostridium sp.]MDY6228856.1 recombinase family protein [Clostridium sp.]OKZ75568.1 MAG: resolvase [Clostridium sp. 26_22]